jgi:DNA replication and repair protein RecF
MHLKSLSLVNYRNYDLLELNPSMSINVFYGFNAQGKTNLLESIYYLATTRSHRSNKDLELLKWDNPYFQIKGLVESHQRDYNLDITYQRDGKKIAKVAGLKKDRLPEYIGSLSVVLFSPEDLAIVKGGPKERRRFLDLQIAQISPNYAYQLIQYQKILSQRNNVLKTSWDLRKDSGQLDVWDTQLINIGSKILLKRFEVLRKLLPLAKLNHNKISAGKENLEIKYISSCPARPDFSSSEIEDSYRTKLLSVRKDELSRGTTLIGPHRDDLNFYINNIDAKLFGSQGQQRSTALSLKLAELELMFVETGEYPVLLLDDVLSELDNMRRHYLLTSVRQKVQTFVTTTNLEFMDKEILSQAKIFRVDEGKIIEQ